MERSITRNILRFGLLVLLQGLILHRINLGGSQFNYILIFIYPLFIVLLPIQIGRGLLILLAFLLGLSIDVFYDSPGLHASASVFTAFIRPFVLVSVQPRGGYKINALPNREQFGFNWFFRYCSILLVFHLFWYFLIEAFQLSQIFMVLYVLIFNPKD
jgi:hypothetical protein